MKKYHYVICKTQGESSQLQFRNHNIYKILYLGKTRNRQGMTEGKKNQHILAINQALAEFDIQTHVRKFSLETLDAFMKGNQQAFDYIKESEKKFINFESRLSKAETYYKNIQTNINSKIEVTNLLSERLEKFTDIFYSGMRESTESVEQMRKNFIKVSRETGNQANTLRGVEQQMENLDKKLLEMSQKIDLEINSLLSRFNQSDQLLQKGLSERKEQAETILVKVSEAKSLLNSKSDILTDLLLDMKLYRQEKPSIQSRFQQLFEQLSNRIVKSEFYEIRRYIDNGNVKQKNRVNKQIQNLISKIQEEQSSRVKKQEQLSQSLSKVNLHIAEKFNNVNLKLKQNHEEATKSIESLKNQMKEKFDAKEKKILKNQKQIIDIFEKLEQMDKSIHSVDQNLAEKADRIIELESNVMSINNQVSEIIQDNVNRREELARLQVDSQEQGNVGDQVRKIGEKIMGMDEILKKQQQAICHFKGEYHQFFLGSQKDVKELKDNLKSLSIKQEKQITHLQQKIQIIKEKLSKKVEENYVKAVEKGQQNLTEKMDAIRDKFDFLEQVNTEIKAFKQKFAQQLKQSAEINAGIKQKMDRIFTMFTKLKSDFFLKVEQLHQDHSKLGLKVKESSNNIESLSRLINQLSELITIMLGVGIWKEHQQEKQKTMYRIASVIEGWVIEIDEKDRFKFRGESIQRKNLLQVALEHYIKFGDKMKGGIFQNGKQIFVRMISGSQEYQQVKKRAQSRRRQSQLPKLYH